MSTKSHSSDGSFGDFSMENYTIDIAQLGRNTGAPRPVGYEQAFRPNRESHEPRCDQHENVDDGIEEAESDEDQNLDLMRGYEVDLGGLGDKPSSIVVEDAVQLRDDVPSEDEGPEDFTQNMEMWIRGNKKWEPTRNEELAEGHEPDPDPELDLRHAMAGDEASEESVFEPLGTSTPAPKSNHVIIQNGVEEEGRMQPPPLTRLSTEMAQNQAAEEVFDRISALQAEVESLRAEGEARIANHQALQEEHRDLIERHESSENDHRIKYDVFRDEYARLETANTAVKDTLKREKKDLTREYNSAMEQIRLLDEQHQETGDGSLEEQNHRLHQELEAIKKAAEKEGSAAKSEIESLHQELESCRSNVNIAEDKLQSLKEIHRSEVDQLKLELESRQKEVALERKESIDRANEVASLADSISEKEQKILEKGDEVKSLNNELGHTLEQLAETRRIVESVEDENECLERRNERQASEIADLMASIMNEKLHEPTTYPPKEKSVKLIEEVTHKAILEALAQQHQIMLTSQRADYEKELQTFRDVLLQIKEESAKNTNALVKAHAEQIDSLKDQLTTLQSQKLSSPPSSSEAELRTAIRVLNTKLSNADASLVSARAEAEAARQETENTLRKNAIVNAELEARFAEAIENREKEWRRRVELLFKEREKMAKALLWGWGRDDFGPSEREQAFRYKHAKTKQVI